MDGYMAVVIPQNTVIPCCESRIFTTSFDNAAWVELNVFEGDSSKTMENHHLGEFRLTGIRHAPEGEPQIEVKFQYDVDRILSVTARDVDTNACLNVQFATCSP